jgi:hypothetical protein
MLALDRPLLPRWGAAMATLNEAIGMWLVNLAIEIRR